ncbi:MAG: NAD-dependent epimerase/dehydratase family protein [Planctomycetota bacterium]
MRVLITGASGFLGRYVVAEAVRRGHEVTALVRPSRNLPDGLFPAGVKTARADVRNRDALMNAVEGVDAVVHLAACVVGDDDTQFASTVVGTENLLAAMVEKKINRLIHCSTFSVYDWRTSGDTLDEQSPLEPDLYARDGYAISKTWQERLVRRAADSNDWHLAVLRPGFIWGAGNELIAGIGQSVGPMHLVIGGSRPLPLTYVENCADCFLNALESDAPAGETFNVIDTDTVSAWRYMGQCLDAGVAKGFRFYLPNWVGISAATVASWTSRLLFGPTGKLPGLFVPIKFRARFRPLQFPNQKARKQLHWHSKYTVRAAWDRIRLGEGELLSVGPTTDESSQPRAEKSLV